VLSLKERSSTDRAIRQPPLKARGGNEAAKEDDFLPQAAIGRGGGELKKSLDGLHQKQWSTSAGIGGRLAPAWMVDFPG